MKSTLKYRLVLTILLFGILGYSQKTDKVYLNNGDVITGEIKQLDFGKLKFSTNHASTIFIDWNDIRTFKTDKFLDIGFEDGSRIFGSIDSSSDSGQVVIQEMLGSSKVMFMTIVEMTPIKNTFWSRIDGVIEVGGSYTKASDIIQLNGKFNAEYRGKNSLVGYRTSFMATEQTDNSNQKSDLSLYYTRFIGGNWYLKTDLNGSRNTELGLNWRVLYGGSVGHAFIKKVYSRFEGGIGVYYNGENSIDTNTIVSSVESAFSLSFRKLKYETPEVDIYTQLTVYPSLTETGRVRVQYDLQTKFEIVKDFYIGADYYLSYDNKPISETGSTLDYGIIGKVGYSF